jgi:hypothetical protein
MASALFRRKNYPFASFLGGKAALGEAVWIFNRFRPPDLSSGDDFGLTLESKGFFPGDRSARLFGAPRSAGVLGAPAASSYYKEA